MIDIEDQIRIVLHDEADALAVPETLPGVHVARVIQMPPPRRRARIAMTAAAAALVLAAGVVLAQHRSEPPAAGSVPAPAAVPGFHFETPTVVMDADSVEVIAADRIWVPTADLVVGGDPGMPNEYTSLELTWHDGGIEQRINIYFSSDGVDWWAKEIRTYDGQRQGEWVEPAALGEYFRNPLGTAFIGDLDLPNLRIHGITLEAFRRPSVCAEPTTPIALLADYPVIDSFVGGYGATFQVIDTATCSSLPVAAYTFDYIADDPTIVAIDPPEVFPDYPPVKTRVGLQLLAPGTTTVHATATNEADEIVATAEMQITVRPLPEDTTTIDAGLLPAGMPPAAVAPAAVASIATETRNRLDYLNEALAPLAFTANGDATVDPQTGIGHLTATHPDDVTMDLTITPGTTLIPEDHGRTPIVIVNQTDLSFTGRVASNSGWIFDITITAPDATVTLPTIEAVQEMIYRLDP